MELRTSKLSMRFDPAVSNFTRIENLTTGENYVKQVPRDPLVDLFGLVDGKISKLEPALADIAAFEDRLVLHYSSFGGYSIRMDVECKCRDDKVIISGNIHNASNIDVVEILMPHIGGIYLGTSLDDYIIYPHHAGERTKNPVLGYGVNKKDFWRASSVAFEDIYRREINYCGLASMSWMYYYNKTMVFTSAAMTPDSRLPVSSLKQMDRKNRHGWLSVSANTIVSARAKNIIQVNMCCVYLIKTGITAQKLIGGTLHLIWTLTTIRNI